MQARLKHVFAALMVLLMSSLGAAGSIEATLDASERKITPEASMQFTDTIRHRVESDTCLETTESNGSLSCTSWDNSTSPGKHAYYFNFDNVDVTEESTDVVRIDATLKPNELTKQLQQLDKNPRLNKTEFADWFNENYYWKGGNISEQESEDLLAEAKNTPVNVVKGTALETPTTASVMSGSGTYTFKVETSSDGEAKIKIGANSGVVTVSDEVGEWQVQDGQLGMSAVAPGNPAFDSIGKLKIGYEDGAFQNNPNNRLLNTAGDNPVLQYRFDQTGGASGDSVNDYSGYLNDASLGTSQPSKVTGMWGTEGVNFNEVSKTDGINENNQASSLQTEQQTIAFWLKIDSSNNDAGNKAIWINQNFDSAGAIYGFNEGNGYYARVAGGGSTTAATFGSAPTTDKWVHVAFVNNAGDITVYENGQQVGNAKPQTMSGGVGSTAYIQCESLSGTNCDASVDEFFVYNKTLSQDAIKLLAMNGGQPYTTSSICSGGCRPMWQSAAQTYNAGEPADWQNLTATYNLDDSTQELDVKLSSYDGSNTLQGTENVQLTDTAGTQSTKTFDLTGLPDGEYLEVTNLSATTSDVTTSPTMSSLTVGYNNQESAPSFTLTSPNDGASFTYDYGTNGADVTFDYSVSASYSGTVELVLDGNVEATHSYGGGTSTAYSDTITSIGGGTHTWEVRLTSDSTGTTYNSASRTFTTQEASPSEPTVSTQNPNNGEIFTYQEGESGANVTFDWSVTAGDESGTSALIVDTTQETSRSFSSLSSNAYSETITLTAGNYSYYATANTTTYSKQSTTKDFEVREQAEAAPKFTLTNPLEGAILQYVEGTNGYNTSFQYGLEAPNAGEVILKVNGTVIATHQISAAGSYSFEDYKVQTNTTYNWNIVYNSDQTGNTYSSTSNQYTVEQIEEQPPNVTINEPDGSVSLYPLGWNFTSDFAVEWAGQGDLNVSANSTYPSKYEQVVIKNLTVASASSKGFTEGFSISNETNRTLGSYTFEVISKSDNGNTYTDLNAFTINDEPTFQLAAPQNNDTITVRDGQKTSLDFSIGSYYGGDYSVRVKEQTEGSQGYVNIYNGTHPGGNSQESIQVSITDGQEYTFKDKTGYDWQLVMTSQDNNTYLSSPNSFSVSKLGLLERVANWVVKPLQSLWNYLTTDLLGTAGQLFLGVLFMLGLVAALAFVKFEAGILAIPIALMINVLVGLWPVELAFILVVLAGVGIYFSVAGD